MKISFFFVTLVLMLSAKAAAVDLTASGGVLRMVNASNLTAGAGSNLIATFTDVAATTLDIVNTGSPGKWRIDVRRSDTTWNNNLKLYVKRISDGSGNGTVTGGLSFVEITSSDSWFITGTGDRSGLSLSYVLTGISVSVAPNIYSTNVTFAAVILP